MEDRPIGNIVIVKDRFVRGIAAIFEAESYALSQVESRDWA